ncbi:MAG: shikimate dehydrogenase [Oscillospiraceae bacterium]|nr:shikimate dehydrogenase [Oscillospiraceae bacterium]
MNSCYLIGEHLGHSFSGDIHRQFGRYEYDLKELAPSELKGFLKRRDFLGLNVTIPYKEAVIPYLDHLDEQAAAIGAVNTVVNRNGVLWGYNTDFVGMREAICRFTSCVPGRSILSGKTVLVLGTGGAAKTAVAVCRSLGAGETLRVSRSEKEGALTYEEAWNCCSGAAWIINCTPVGMFPDLEGLPFNSGVFHFSHSPQGESPACFPHLEGVFDCVYNPLRTRLVLAAQERGIPASGGLYMLVKQAAFACELFTGKSVAEPMIEEIYKKLRFDRENLVLIGMPGAGKTTVGYRLAARIGKKFVDLDEEIVRRAGKSVSAIFSQEGENSFRELEAKLISELASQGGKVIATGGGTILRRENVIRLRQNGRLFFLDRSPEALNPTADRPLSDTAEKLRILYAERYQRYLAAADHVIANQDDLEKSVQEILMRLQQ